MNNTASHGIISPVTEEEPLLLNRSAPGDGNTSDEDSPRNSTGQQVAVRSRSSSSCTSSGRSDSSSEQGDEEDYDDEYDDDEGDKGDDGYEDPTTLHLRILSSSKPSNNSNNSNNSNVTVRSTDTVARVKQAVVAALGPHAQNRYLRLIVKGRLLAPDTKPLGEFAVESGDVLHAVLAAKGERGGAQALLAQGAGAGGGVIVEGLHNRLDQHQNFLHLPSHHRTLLRGAGITPTGLAVRWNDRSTAEMEDDDDDSAAAGDLEGGRQQQQQRLGFDRLRTTHGLRRSQVTALRAYFSRQVDRWIRLHPEAALQAAEGESDLLRRRLLQEEAWMQTQGPASELRLNLAGSIASAPLRLSMSNHLNNPHSAGAIPPWQRSTRIGTDRDFMWGFLLGFFVGFFMLVWVWMPTVPHKQKLGILTGISVQLALTMLHGGSSSEGESTDDDP